MTGTAAHRLTAATGTADLTGTNAPSGARILVESKELTAAQLGALANTHQVLAGVRVRFDSQLGDATTSGDWTQAWFAGAVPTGAACSDFSTTDQARTPAGVSWDGELWWIADSSRGTAEGFAEDASIPSNALVAGSSLTGIAALSGQIWTVDSLTNVAKGFDPETNAQPAAAYLPNVGLSGLATDNDVHLLGLEGTGTLRGWDTVAQERTTGLDLHVGATPTGAALSGELLLVLYSDRVERWSAVVERLSERPRETVAERLAALQTSALGEAPITSAGATRALPAAELGGTVGEALLRLEASAAGRLTDTALYGQGAWRQNAHTAATTDMAPANAPVVVTDEMLVTAPKIDTVDALVSNQVTVTDTDGRAHFRADHDSADLWGPRIDRLAADTGAFASAALARHRLARWAEPPEIVTVTVDASDTSTVSDALLGAAPHTWVYLRVRGAADGPRLVLHRRVSATFAVVRVELSLISPWHLGIGWTLDDSDGAITTDVLGTSTILI